MQMVFPLAKSFPSTGSFSKLKPLGLVLVLLFGANSQARDIQLKTGQPESAFDGWGTSLCWFANAVGRWPQEKREALADALFSEKGLGLTVLRYNIGGGEQTGHRHMPWFRQMEGFLDERGIWHWDRDAGQRWMLEAARQRGATRFEAFANSPPWWMTRSRCASGAEKASDDNLAPGREEAFARYLATVVKHFRTDWGIRFSTLNPLNEPASDYWHAGHNQEGCHFSPASQASLLRTLRKVLDEEGLKDLGLSASDETNPTRAIETWQAFDESTRACIAQVNVHTYDTDHRTEFRLLIERSGKPLVMSEVDGAGEGGHQHEAIQPALALAKNIMDDLRYLRPLRWVLWQAVEDEANQRACNGNWGLIHADLEGSSHAWVLTKKYHVMAQFTRFIRPGASLLRSESPDQVLALDRERKQLIIVLRNAGKTEEPSRLDFSAYAPLGKMARVLRSSATENCATLPEVPVENARLHLTLAPESVTTLVIPLADGPS